MIIDSHVHAGESLFGHSLSAGEIQKEMDRLGIDRAVLVPFKPPGYHMGPANDLVAGIVRQHPERFLGLGRVDPWQGESALREARRIFERLGLSGLFIHPWEECCPLTAPVLQPLMELAGKAGKPVMISGGHVRVSHPRQVEYLARKHPDVTIIATSGGQIDICGQLMWDAEEMLSACPNVILETSGIYRRDFIEQMSGKLGPERVMFGSGSPYFHQEFEMERITSAQVPAPHRDMILGGSAARIFGE
jgi:predicted TIM-barrel fold metal-dependent hydrolase